jgi:hypothetical protein
MSATHAQANRQRMILTSMRSVEKYLSRNTAAWSSMKAFTAKCSLVTDPVPEDTTGPRPHHIEQHRRIKDTMHAF